MKGAKFRLRLIGDPEEIIIKNCGGLRDATHTVARERKFIIELDMTVSDKVAAELGGDIKLARATLRSEIGVEFHISIGTETVSTASLEIVTPPGYETKTTIQWKEKWTKGEVEVLRDNGTYIDIIPFALLDSVNLEQIDTQTTKCQDKLEEIIPPSPVPQDTVISAPVVSSPTAQCMPEVGWVSPEPTSDGEWIYKCLSSGPGNWVGQDEAWKASNWKRGTSQSEIVNILVPEGATTMGLGCDPCTVMKPDGTTVSSVCNSSTECFGPFKPNLNFDVNPGETYKVRIFGGDTCPSRPSAQPPCPPELYIWFNLIR